MSLSPTLSRRDFITAAGAAALATSLPSVMRSEPSAPTAVALVGAAHIHTPGYIKALKGRSDIVVKAVWDHDPARAAKAASDLGSTVVASVDAIWSDPAIKAVVICSETNRHHDLVIAGAQAGKHLYVEKPLGINGQESRAMAKAIEDAKVLFTTGYFMRCDPKHLFLKKEVAAGNLGVITRVRASNCHGGSLGRWFDTDFRWMADPKIAGVGAFGDLGTHKLDILMWIFGDLESGTASLRTITDHYPGCDECGEALLKFKSGIVGTLGAGWVDVDDPVKFLISGTEGHAVIINNQLFYTSKRTGSKGKEPYPDLPAGPQVPIQQFFAALAGSKDQPLVRPSEAAARVVAMEALYQAASENRWIPVG